MRIGINLLYLLPGVVGGTETYAAGLLQGMAVVAAEDEFLVFVNREAADWPFPTAPNFKRIVCPVSGSNRAQRYYFEQIKLPKILRQHQADLIHSLGYVGPVFNPCPSVLTIPDLNYFDIAQTIPIHRRFPLRLISSLSAKNASAIITISEFSKGRLCETLKLPGSKITVTHLAPRMEMTAKTNAYWPAIKQHYGIHEPYLVAFAGGAVHKNIPALLEAFAMVGKTASHSLILIGHTPPDVDISKFERQHNLQGRIITTGYAPGAHISPLLRHAELFVLPSLYEGFGLPVLEAQQAGVAVACSTAGSLPEVAGDGAVFFDPYSVESISEALERCLSDVDLRTKLRQQGRENLKRFSWEKTAEKTLTVYERTISGISKDRTLISSDHA